MLFKTPAVVVTDKMPGNFCRKLARTFLFARSPDGVGLHPSQPLSFSRNGSDAKAYASMPSLQTGKCRALSNARACVETRTDAWQILRKNTDGEGAGVGGCVPPPFNHKWSSKSGLSELSQNMQELRVRALQI